MANTVQTQTVKTILSVDLSTVTADRLIELCILYRSVPDADKKYSKRLKAELKRRYDAAAINNDATTYAVLQHFSNQFGGASGGFTRKMEEIAASAYKEAAFKQNEQWFKEQIEDSGNMDWLASSDTAMSAVAASSTAMTAIAASSTAMTAIAASSTARDALIAHNDVLQSVRKQMYRTVSRSRDWSKKRGTRLNDKYSGVRYEGASSALATPSDGIVFVCLGAYGSGYGTGRHMLEHPDGSVAARGGYRDSPTSLVDIDGISFAGAKVKQTDNFGGSYAEVWAPN